MAGQTAGGAPGKKSAAGEAPDKAEEITVRVPEARVGEFYALFGAWLQSDAPTPPSPPTADLRPWDKARDREPARKVLERLRHPNLELVLLLLDRYGQPVHWKDLGSPVGLTSAFAVASAMTWAAREFVAEKKVFPVHVHDAGDGPMYWFDPDLVALFNRARARQADRTTKTKERPA